MLCECSTCFLIKHIICLQVEKLQFWGKGVPDTHSAWFRTLGGRIIVIYLLRAKRGFAGLSCANPGSMVCLRNLEILTQSTRVSRNVQL